MTAPAIPKSPSPGEALRLDGFLYEVGHAEVLVFGTNRAEDVAAFVAANPPLREPGGTRVRLDTENPDRWTVLRGFRRPAAPDAELAARRVANFNYKKAGQCDEADLVWLEPTAYLAEARAQGEALVRGAPTERLRRWRQAWVDANLAELESRLGKLQGAWMLRGRALLKTRPPVTPADTHQPASPLELERADIPAAIAGILTSTLDSEG